MGFKLPNGSDLIAEQLDIINLPTTKNWVIKGAPGTGKTVMAIYRAGQIARNQKVLVLVYNRPLMQFLQTAVKGQYYRNCIVSTYHQWLIDFYLDQFGTKLPQLEPYLPDWSEIERACKRLSKIYEHVIIDEAQDFPIELIRILKGLAKNITCFIDPNQAIEVGKTDTINAIKALCVEAPYTLKRNFRNTKEIRDLSALFCIQGVPAVADKSGKKPMITRCTDSDDMIEKMCRLIRQNKEKSIGVIVNNKSLVNTYNSLEEELAPAINVEVHKAKTSNSIDFDTDGVKIVSYGTMKGLEFDIVLLPRFEKVSSKNDDTVDLNRIYVATSRPLTELYMYILKDYNSEKCIDTLNSIKGNRHLVTWN